MRPFKRIGSNGSVSPLLHSLSTRATQLWLNSDGTDDWVHLAHRTKVINNQHALTILTSSIQQPLYSQHIIERSWIPHSKGYKVSCIVNIIVKTLSGKTTPRYIQQLIKENSGNKYVHSMLLSFVLGSYTHALRIPSTRLCMDAIKMSGSSLYNKLARLLRSNGFYLLVYEYAVAGLYMYSHVRCAISHMDIDTDILLCNIGSIDNDHNIREWVHTNWYVPSYYPKTRQTWKFKINLLARPSVANYLEMLRVAFLSRAVRHTATRSVLHYHMGQYHTENAKWPVLSLPKQLYRFISTYSPIELKSVLTTYATQCTHEQWSILVSWVDGMIAALKFRVIPLFDSSPKPCIVAICRVCRTLLTGCSGIPHKKTVMRIAVVNLTSGEITCKQCKTANVSTIDISSRMLALHHTKHRITACRRCSCPTIVQQVLGTKILCSRCYAIEYVKMRTPICIICSVRIDVNTSFYTGIYDKHRDLRYRGFCDRHVHIGLKFTMRTDYDIQCYNAKYKRK